MLYSIILQVFHVRYNLDDIPKKKKKRWFKFINRVFFFQLLGKNMKEKVLLYVLLVINILMSMLIFITHLVIWLLLIVWAHIGYRLLFILLCPLLGLGLEADILIRSFLQKWFFFTLTLPLVKFLKKGFPYSASLEIGGSILLPWCLFSSSSPTLKKKLLEVLIYKIPS